MFNPKRLSSKTSQSCYHRVLFNVYITVLFFVKKSDFVLFVSKCIQRLLSLNQSQSFKKFVISWLSISFKLWNESESKNVPNIHKERSSRPKGVYRTLSKSEMERFAKIVNSWKPLNIFAKCSIPSSGN